MNSFNVVLIKIYQLHVHCLAYFLQNITIPVRATADMKTDGDQDVFMTVKLVVGGIHAKTMRAKVTCQQA